MGNKVNFMHAINFINLFHTHHETKKTLKNWNNKTEKLKTEKIRQNPEKWVAVFSDKFSWLHCTYIEPKYQSRSYLR